MGFNFENYKNLICTARSALDIVDENGLLFEGKSKTNAIIAYATAPVIISVFEFY